MLIIIVERVHPIILATTVSTLICFPSSLFFINSLRGKRVIRIIISLEFYEGCSKRSDKFDVTLREFDCMFLRLKIFMCLGKCIGSIY